MASVGEAQSARAATRVRPRVEQRTFNDAHLKLGRWNTYDSTVVRAFAHKPSAPNVADAAFLIDAN